MKKTNITLYFLEKLMVARDSFVKTIGLFLFLMLLSTPVFAATYYISPTGSDSSGQGNNGSPWATLAKAFSEMNGGDILIIRDGTYTGDKNRIRLGGGEAQAPPNGSSWSSRTIIKAENEGQVTFDGEEVRFMFNVSSGDFQYMEFDGIKWVNPDYNTPGSSVAITSDSANVGHVKFYRCGAMVGPSSSTGKSTWGISGGSYYLFEECYSWGRGRYGWKIQDLDNGNGAQKVVLRRCVVRLDDSYASNLPISAIQSYCAQEIEVQNCIVIDSDSSYWTSFSYNGSAFNIRSHNSGYGYATDVHFRGCIALNNLGWKHGGSDSFAYFAGMQLGNEIEATPNTVDNCVLWNVMQGIRNTDINHGMDINNVTIFSASNPDMDGVSNNGGFGGNFGSSSYPFRLRNSAIIDGGDKYAIRHLATSEYNSITTPGVDFDNVPAGTNDYTDDNDNELNPLVNSIKYIVRIEKNSDLSTKGSSSANVGGTVLYRYGKDGTFWGEDGYNTITDVPLWPFPYEDQIKADFSSYNPEGGPSGKRGFCADGKTLTNYIWGYLGNTLPPFKVRANGGKGKVYLGWLPNRYDADVARYNIYMKTGSGDYTLIKQVNDDGINYGRETFKSALIDGLTNGVEYKFVIRTVDSGGESGNSYEVSATPGPNPPYPPNP